MDILDFSYVKDLDEFSSSVFFSILDSAIDTMQSAIQKDLDNGGEYLQSLTTEQKAEMYTYYSKVLNLYTEYELYEECEGIKFILETIKKD